MKRKYRQIWILMFCYRGHSEVFEAAYGSRKLAVAGMLETAGRLSETFTVENNLEITIPSKDFEDSSGDIRRTPVQTLRITRRTMRI